MNESLVILLALAIVALVFIVAVLAWLFHVEHGDRMAVERHLINAIIAGRATGSATELKTLTALTVAERDGMAEKPDARAPRDRHRRVGTVDRDHERALVEAGAVDDRGDPVHPVGFDD